MKTSYCIILSLLCGIAMNACSYDLVPESSFEALCSASGGTIILSDPNKNLCECGGETCADGVLCRKSEESDDKICAGDGHEYIKTISCTTSEERKCDDGAIHVCLEGKWEIESVCPDNASCKADHKSCGDCSDGSTICKEDDSGVGTFTFCANGELNNMGECPSGFSCNADRTACGECHNDATKCEFDKNYQCVNGEWVAGEDCQGSCKDSYECGECLNGTNQCKDGKYRPCVNGEWFSIDIPCEWNQCESESACAPEPECNGDDTECVNDAELNYGIKRVCQNGFWKNTECENNLQCRPDNSDCAECKDKEQKCFSNDENREDGLYTCVDGTWTFTESCQCNVEGTGCMECNPGSSQCIDQYTYHVCDTAGNWGTTVQKCPQEQICVQSTAERSICRETCEENSQQCTNNAYRKCTKGTWTTPEDCEYGCNEDNKTCNECEANSKECKDGKIRTCNKGKWESFIDCPVDGCYDTTTCLSCIRNSTTCTNNQSKIGQLTTCTDGKSTTNSSCRNVSCNSKKTDCGECLNGTNTCQTDAKTGIGKNKSCNTGQLNTLSNCPSEYSCTPKKICGQCNITKSSCYGYHSNTLTTTIPVKQTCSKGYINLTFCNTPTSKVSCSSCTPYGVFLAKSSGQDVNIRKSPEGTVSGYYLNKGDEVIVYGKSDKWYLIGQLSGNKATGWSHQDYISRQTATDYTVIAESASIQNTQSTSNAQTIGELKKDSTVKVYQFKDPWYKIIHNGQIGWIHKNEIKKK